MFFWAFTWNVNRSDVRQDCIVQLLPILLTTAVKVGVSHHLVPSSGEMLHPAQS